MTVGRNDPCPCGSGKKFKKCHGLESTFRAAPHADVTRANALKACDMHLNERLMRFARQRYGPDWLVEVLDADGLLNEEGVVPDEEMSLVIPWLQHCRRDETGFTLAETWRLQSPRLTPDEVALLEAYDDAWLSIWEIADVDRGKGSRVIDALTSEERYANDVSSSATLQRHDAILGIVLSCDGVSFFGGVHAQPLTPRFAGAAIREARRLCRVRTRPVAVKKLRDPRMQIDLMTIWTLTAIDMRVQPPPVLQNTDGDPFRQTTDDYALVARRDDVAARLATLEGAQAEGDEGDAIVFVITKIGNALHRQWENTVVGRIVLSAARLKVETNSTRRADTLRASVERHLGSMVRFRLRSEANMADLLAQARQAPSRSTQPEPMPPEALAAVRTFREQHMRDWLDDSIPALGGLTPREAAKTHRGRQEVLVLLKEFEQHEARVPRDQRIDLGWIRGELDLTSS